jgi:endonuclease/exonuclease/phosphatase family metal-dependent hydrolase
VRTDALFVLTLLAAVGCAQSSHPPDRMPSASVDDPQDPLSIMRGETGSSAASTHPRVLRMVVWNIKSGRDSSIEAIAARLATLDADVFVLQEVDSKTRRSGGVDQPSALRRTLGLNYVFAPTIHWDGGIYGIATLSRYAFGSVERIAISNENVDEPRTALDTSLQLPDATLRVVNHHADVLLPAAVRGTSDILQHIQASLGSGLALVGDFNQVPSDEGPQACVAAGLVDVGHGYGDAATDGARRIDYVFLDKVLASCVRDMRVEPLTESDHNALVVDFDLACM